MLKINDYLVLDEVGQKIEDKAQGSTIPLTYSESAILACFVQQPNDVFTKEQLLAVGWPDRVVAASSLTQCISTLRKKLEPYPELQLKTLARRGYQLQLTENSAVTMVAIHDARSVGCYLLQASILVKLLGVVIGLILALWVWYHSDYHRMLQQSKRWSVEQLSTTIRESPATRESPAGDAALTMGQALPVFHINAAAPTDLQGWLKHFSAPIEQAPFQAFAALDRHVHSLALCFSAPNLPCDVEQRLNLTFIDQQPVQLDLDKLFPLAQQMELRQRYNRIAHLPQSLSNLNTELIEHTYQADVYFPVAEQLLVRSDIAMSVIFNEDDQDTGRFYFSACITDQDCLSSPIKYHFDGNFQRYQQQMGEYEVEVFHVKVEHKNFLKPETISDASAYFFKQLRKHELTSKEVFFYRVHQDQQTAVWIVPQMDHLMVWSKYMPVAL